MEVLARHASSSSVAQLASSLKPQGLGNSNLLQQRSEYLGHGRFTTEASRRPSQQRLAKAGAVRAAASGSKFEDTKKEESLPYRRVVYDMAKWRQHRSSYRHSRHLQTLPGSRIIRALLPPTSLATISAFLICAYDSAWKEHILPSQLPLLHISPLPFQLTSAALGLLLVFRTNASYNRFDEARKLWGATLNRVRDVARQTLAYVTNKEDNSLQAEVLRHMKAYPLALKYHLIAEGDLEEDLRVHLTPKELQAVMAAAHRPGYILQVISNCFARAKGLDQVQRLMLDPNMTAFYDQLGGMERLFKTPIPLSYTRLTSRFMVLWHILLPLGLWDSCGWLSIPATTFSAAALFCIEEVGVVIEEPFSILALAAICGSCVSSVENLTKEDKMYRESVAEVESQNGQSVRV